ncbi:MAG: hypothetical protein HYZ50_01495 [Deltaproteobacteria bacterium]|nr:hypothetical protein [Deltaproteobacteria bacterium]
MKIGLVIAVLIAVIGIYLVTLGVTSGESISLLGVTFHPSVARGVGIISLILSLITGLVAYGSSLPPSAVERHHK